MCFVFMLPYAFFDVAGEADIERVRSACNDINPEVSLTHSAMLLEIKATAGLSTALRFGRDDELVDVLKYSVLIDRPSFRPEAQPKWRDLRSFLYHPQD